MPTLLKTIAALTATVLVIGLSATAQSQNPPALPNDFFYNGSGDKPKIVPPAEKAPAPKAPRQAGHDGEPNAKSTQRGRFSRDGQGIVTDSRTKLQWYLGPNQDMSWTQAQAWAEGLGVGGGGWRLPTMSELRDIYGSGIYVEPGKRYSFRIDPAFQLTGCCPWSSESTDGRRASFILFNGGGESSGNRDSVSSGSRGLAVRAKR